MSVSDLPDVLAGENCSTVEFMLTGGCWGSHSPAQTEAEPAGKDTASS